MKRVLIVLTVVWMVAMLVAFTPYTPANLSDASYPKVTPTPGRTATPAPSKLTPTPGSIGLTAPTLLSPANGATIHTGSLTFSWTRVPGAVRYHLQAGNGTAFDEQYNIIEYWGLTEPSYTFNVTSGFVFYFPHLYWRVQAIDANHVRGPWSEVRVIHLVSP